MRGTKLTNRTGLENISPTAARTNQTEAPSFDISVGEVLGAAPDAFVALARDWRFLYLNGAAERLLNRRIVDLTGKVLWDEFPEAADSQFSVEYRRAMRSDATVNFTAFYPPLERWFAVQAVPQRHGLSVYFHDVTSLKQAEEHASRLASMHASLRTVATAVAAEARPEVIFDLVCRQSAELVDAAAAALIRFDKGDYEVAATSTTGDADLPPVGMRLDVRAGSEVDRVRSGESVAVEDNAGNRIGELGYRSAVLVPVRVAGGVWGCLAVMWRDENRQAAAVEPWLVEFGELVSVAVGNTQARRELSRRAATDPLTGLANLRTLHGALDSHVAHDRPRGSVALALIDIDHFKHINDGRGHATGDAVLKMVAAELNAVCRAEDVAARIGGDEFALVLDHCDVDTAVRVAERVRLKVRNATEAAELPTVTVSIGVSAWEPGLDREAIQRRADDAMYWAKLHGRDATWAYNAELMDAPQVEQRSDALRRSKAVADPVMVEQGLRAAKTFWQSALDGLSKHIAVIDETGRIIATNAAWRRFSETNEGEADRTGVGVNYLDLCDAAGDPIAAQVAASLRGLLNGEREDFELDYPCDAPDRERWFTVRANRFGGGHPKRVIILHEDISARRIAERRSSFQAKLLDFIAMPVFAYDAERRLTYWNGACESLYGRPAADVMGRSVDELGVLDLSGEDAGAMRRQLAEYGSGEWELTSVHNCGSRFPTAITAALVRNAHGEPDGVIGTVFDLTERAAHQRDLRAARDFLHTVTESVADGLLVIDGQGSVTYANSAARALLADGDQIAGREALGVLYGDQPTAAAAGLLDQHASVRTATDEFRRTDGVGIAVEWTAASLTTATDSDSRQTPALTNGGSRVIVFRDISDRLADEDRLKREAEGLRCAKYIREALDEDRFELHAQPIVAIRTGEVVDHELLIRLRDADGSLVPPGRFLPAAEEHGLMTAIDLWVTEQAVALAATGMSVHFNLSARSIGDMDILVALRRAVERTDADPRLLTIELTETALLHDREQAAAFTRHLRRRGFHVALDDFGAGYNSFARIKDVPADVIKIDRQFIGDLLVDPASESVIKGVLAFAADLDVRVVAEGIEDAVTQRRLDELGVEFGQGFHFGRPAPLVLPPRRTVHD